MKYLTLGLLAILLVGCNDSRQFLPKSIPPGLQDCKFYELTMGMREVIVVRCPQSETAAEFRQSSGKTSVSRNTVTSS